MRLYRVSTRVCQTLFAHPYSTYCTSAPGLLRWPVTTFFLEGGSSCHARKKAGKQPRKARRGRRIALYGKIYSAILCYISGAIYAGSPPASPNFVVKLECRMEYEVCTPLANLERKICIKAH